jgi:hypothetical protein
MLCSLINTGGVFRAFGEKPLKKRDSRHRGARGLSIFLLAVSFGLIWAAGASATPPTPPTIGTEWVTGVTQHNAVLHAEINPNGSLTKYKLQIDTTGHFKFDQNDTCALHPPSVACGWIMITGEPLPAGLKEPSEGSIPAGNDPVEVSADLANIGATLQPNTTYYYRAIAASGVPEVEGPTQTFKTPSATPSPPVVESAWTSDITTDDVTLHATINPHGLETEYQFVLSEPCPEPGPGEVSCMAITELPLPEGTIPASYESVQVSVSASDGGYSLNPGTKYEWAIRAENDEGQTFPSGQSFFTNSPPVIEGESVSGLTPTDATLEAEIDPGVAPAGVFYQFQLLPDPGEAPTEIACPASGPPGFSVCAGPQDSGALPLEWMPGDESGTVSLDLATAGVTLEPGRQYFFRVLAANQVPTEDTAEWEAPAVFGNSEAFTTPTHPVEEDNSQPAGATGGSQQASDSSSQLIPKQGGQPKRHCKRKPRRAGQRHRKKSQRALRCIR